VQKLIRNLKKYKGLFFLKKGNLENLQVVLE